MDTLLVVSTSYPEQSHKCLC